MIYYAAILSVKPHADNKTSIVVLDLATNKDCISPEIKLYLGAFENERCETIEQLKGFITQYKHRFIHHFRQLLGNDAICDLEFN